MKRTETRILENLEKHSLLIYLICAVVLSAVIRALMFPFISDDMDGYLLGWYGQIQQLGGMHALKTQVGNYSVAYQTIIAILTYLPFEPVVEYKVVSCIFDYVLALAVFLLIYDKENACSKKYAITAFIITVLSPVVFMNSAMWGQCDAIYTSFVVLSLVMYKKEKYPLCFLFFGLAFSFKLQTVFYLPFFIFDYVRRKKYSIVNFLITPLTMIVMCIPAYIMGRGFKAFISTYYYQTESCDAMSFNYPSFWTVISTNSDNKAAFTQAMKIPAIIITVIILASLMIVLIKNNADLQHETWLYTMLLMAFTCVEFLPGMHERYAYPIEILAIVTAFKQKKTIPLAIWLSLSSMITYGSYFFKGDINLQLLGILNLATYIAYIAILLPQITSSKFEGQNS